MDALVPALGYAVVHPFQFAFYSTTLALLATVVYWLYRIFLSPHFSSIRSLPGPEFIHPLWGNLQEFTDKEPGRAHADWAIQYGGAVRYRGLLGENLLMLSDPTALTYLLTANPYNYAKPADLRGDLERILGKGVVFAEGDDHRRHRRLLAPAFAHGHIKAMAPCFFDLAYQLKEIWTEQIDSRAVDMSAWKYKLDLETYETNKPPGEAVIEVSDTLTRLALDAIGKVGFDYEFNALSGHTNALSQAFYTLYSPRGAYLSPPPWVMLLHKAFGAIFHTLPRNLTKLILGDRGKSIHQAARDVEKESRKIITAKKEVIAQEGSDSLKGKKDLISILLSSAEPDAKAWLTPEELRGQLNSFTFAGHDTISNTLSWILWALACHPEKQDRLREEIRKARIKALSEGRKELDSEELSSLEYLDACTREVLRLEPALATTPRVSLKDDLIPLSATVPSATDPSCTLSHVRVKKGQVIYLGIYAANRNKTVFGDDADSFRPERWIDPACKIESKMGVWAGLMTFLAGPRSCIGYKFALLEIKVVLSVLIDAFEFAPRDPNIRVERGVQVITRPYVVGEFGLGTRMPLKVRFAKREDSLGQA
ncbi:hypothetical protein JCM1841_004053 [Sporobolomyces salmonicolor]